MPGFACSTGDKQPLGTHLLHKRFNYIRPVVKRGGVYRWSDEKLNSGARKVEATLTQCPFAN